MVYPACWYTSCACSLRQPSQCTKPQQALYLSVYCALCAHLQFCVSFPFGFVAGMLGVMEISLVLCLSLYFVVYIEKSKIFMLCKSERCPQKTSSTQPICATPAIPEFLNPTLNCCQYSCKNLRDLTEPATYRCGYDFM